MNCIYNIVGHQHQWIFMLPTSCAQYSLLWGHYVFTLSVLLSICPDVCPMPTLAHLQHAGCRWASTQVVWPAHHAGHRLAVLVMCQHTVRAGEFILVPSWVQFILHSCANIDSPANGQVRSVQKIRRAGKSVINTVATVRHQMTEGSLQLSSIL